MADDLQWVSLAGGSFDGQVARAPLPPGALRLYARTGDDQWSELYLYANGRVTDHPDYGTLLVMQFQERKEEN